jgi:hypothetical protein
MIAVLTERITSSTPKRYPAEFRRKVLRSRILAETGVTL